MGTENKQEAVPLVPMPAQATFATFHSTIPLTPIVCDERAIAKLIETLLSRAGLSIGEASRRLGVTTNAIRQYTRGRRVKPSLMWFIRLAELCGARVSIELGARGK